MCVCKYCIHILHLFWRQSVTTFDITTNRVAREGKERRRKWAQKKTPRPSTRVESVQDASETETHQESLGTAGMLPPNIVELLAAREKYDSFFNCFCVYVYVYH